MILIQRYFGVVIVWNMYVNQDDTIFPLDLARFICVYMDRPTNDIYLVIQSERELKIERLEFHIKEESAHVEE